MFTLDIFLHIETNIELRSDCRYPRYLISAQNGNRHPLLRANYECCPGTGMFQIFFVPRAQE